MSLMGKTTEKVGASVRKIRKKKGLSIRELERRSRVSRGVISMLENNKLPNIGIETLKRLADGLEVDLSELIPKTKP